MYKTTLFTRYELPPKTCTHVICDGDFCLINPIKFRDIMEWKYVSCLYIPMLGGFLRGKDDKKDKKTKKIDGRLCYTKKLGTQIFKLYSLEHVNKFLMKHEIKLTIDLFTFSNKINCETAADKHIWWTKCVVEDLSSGVELLQIPVVNTVDDEIPAIREYLTKSVFKNEHKTLQKRTPVCCDCTDNCSDKLNCACFQETLRCYNPDERKTLKKDENIGYDYKRLPFQRQNLSGIYECNDKCTCNAQCPNRVVQFPTKWKLQLFKDEEIKEKGWGVRTLNDIPAGAFVGTYTGTMSQESEADVQSHSLDWLSAGKWKYIVNLQVMQNAAKDSVKLPIVPSKRVCEVAKLTEYLNYLVDYSPKAFKITYAQPDLKRILELPPEFSRMKNREEPEINNADKQLHTFVSCHKKSIERIAANRQIIHLDKTKNRTERRINDLNGANKLNQVGAAASGYKEEGRRQTRHAVIFKSGIGLYRIPTNGRIDVIGNKLVYRKAELTMSKVNSTQSEEDVKPDLSKIKLKEMVSENNESKTSTPNFECKEPKLKLVDLKLVMKKFKTNDEDATTKKGKKLDLFSPTKKTKKMVSTKAKTTKSTVSSKKDDAADAGKGKGRKGTKRAFPSSPAQQMNSPSKLPRLSTPLSPHKRQPTVEGSTVAEKAGTSAIRKGAYSLRKAAAEKNYTFKQYDDLLKIPKQKNRVMPKIKTSKDLYLIDGRQRGNIGRYFNHSCDPNLFCQYVFVDTQDVRFPVVSFFAKKDIKAGTELTWCYNYDDDIDMGIDPIMCHCKAPNCRGVLLC